MVRYSIEKAVMDIKTYFKACISDIDLFLKHNRFLIIATVFFMTWGVFLVKQWHSYQIREDHVKFYEDPALTVVEGENYSEINVPYTMIRGEEFFGSKYLRVSVEKTEKLNSVTLKYDFEVKNLGRYKIFIAGGPPGSREEGGVIQHFSPYEVVIDDLEPIQIDRQKKRKELVKATNSGFFICGMSMQQV